MGGTAGFRAVPPRLETVYPLWLYVRLTGHFVVSSAREPIPALTGPGGPNPTTSGAQFINGGDPSVQAYNLTTQQ